VLCQLIKSYGMSGFFKKGLPALKLALYQLGKQCQPLLTLTLNICYLVRQIY